MRRRTPMVLTGAIATLSMLLVGASSAQFGEASGGHPPQGVTLLSSGPQMAPQAPPAPREPVNLDAMAQQATTRAQSGGADISIAVLDRQTGRLVTSGDGAAFPIASVAKLFIADDLLMGLNQGRGQLSPEDRRGLDLMLRASDDFAANEFWARAGGNAVIARINARYRLGSTTAPYDGNWWNTMSTTVDLVRYYDMLLDGAGGLPPQQANTILADLASSAPVGVDGYPQRFGIPDGLFAEAVAVKQGWMCCWNGPNWVHLSTGVVGSDRRYAVAIGSMQPVDDATARATVTDALKTMFPGGRI